ncbi:MAG: leucine-rich repeat protein [Bacteroidaceae bacterium]|nr:leucine-rich repeat protein [Bacteroidaceae bacterium]
MKRTFSFMRILASIVMSAVALVAIADEYIDPQSKVVYTYEPGSGTAMVKAGYEEIIYRGEDYELDTAVHSGSPDAVGEVAILDRFTIGTEEYVVTSIGELAFSVNRNITSVSIPETVNEIQYEAFSYCTSLIAVQLPEGLTKIAQALFYGCNKLTSVVIPSTVNRIELGAFSGCSSLASLNLPAGIVYVGKDAFYGTPWYSTMYDEAPDGPFYIGSLLLGYKGDKPTGELVIKDGTTCIGNGAFHNCQDLTSVTIPRSVVSVDNNAFQNCSRLTAVHIIDLAAWCGIEFKDEGLSRSSNPLFYAHHLYLDEKEVTDLVIPEGVTSIGSYAFDNCSALTNVTIPDGVTSIGTCAFRKCGSLASVTIPPSVATVESHAFLWCFELKAVHISDLTAWGRISFHDNVSNPLYYGAHLYPTAQSYFYYYKGDKIPLILNKNKVCVSIPTECNLARERIFSNVQPLDTIRDEEFETRVISRSDYEKLTLMDFWKEDSKSVILTSCYYTENYEEVFSTPYLDVRLKKEQDIDLLSSYAERYGLRIVKQNSFMPLWYILSVTLDSKKSPLECANELFESGDFAASEPDLASNIFSQMDYHPLVEEGKHWTYDNYLPVRPAEYNHYYSYDLKGDTLIAGKNCLKMYSDNRYNDGAVRYEAALYEENKKVFCFFPEKEEAVLLYDFDCEMGDTLNVYEMQMVVTDIQAVMPGDIVILKYVLQPVWDEPADYGEVFWIEGVGATMDFFSMVPVPGNYNSLHACELNGEKLYQQAQQDLTEKGYHRMAIEGKRWNYIRFYLDENGEHREPYSYVVKGDTIIGRTTYKKLWYQDATKERLECLLYEEGRTVYKITDPGININGQPVLTVFFDFGRNDFGRVFTWEAEMGARNTNWMVYGVDTIEVKNRQFRRYTCLQKYSEEGESLTTIDYHDESVWRDIWVEGVGSASSGIKDQFPPAEPSIRLPGVYTYFVSCEENGECIFTADDFNIQSGEESPYRPFIEEGKVWKVGDYSGNPVRRVEYFYFDGDTIIDGKNCKQMMCQRYVSPEHPDYSVFSQFPSQSYMGAWYEEDKKVYKYDPTNKEFQLMYDFSLDANDTLWIKNASLPYIVGPRRTGGLKGFKGVYREVMQSYNENPFYNTTWLEGVGSIDGPILNVYYGEEAHAVFLMSCSVEDEVIYLNDEVVDGATPEIMDAQNRRIDFTHTIKTKPKAPAMRGLGDEEESLYGEYNELQLGINLDPLVDAYLVRITDETGNVVYEKAIDAAGIVGLNIDISAYEEGLYTITLENDQESFTGEFEARTTGLSPLLQEKPAETIYNLQGQRLNSLRKGLNIVNGRKVYVK